MNPTAYGLVAAMNSKREPAGAYEASGHVEALGITFEYRAEFDMDPDGVASVEALFLRAPNCRDEFEIDMGCLDYGPQIEIEQACATAYLSQADYDDE